MLYKTGDYVYYRKYLGKVKFVYENKSYMVTLYNYRNFEQIDKQIDENALYPCEQMILI